MIRYLRAALLVFLFSIRPSSLSAQEFDIHGFVQTNFSLRITTTGEARTFNDQPLSDYLLGDERVQLEITRFGEMAQLLGKIDLFYDAVDKRADLDVREVYIDLMLDKIDIRAGRQIITWGVGDLVFINDVFPKNWVAFLSGQPLQYLKFGSDAININFFPKFASIQFVAIPFYQPDVLPRGERLLAFDPFPDIANRNETQPEITLKNTQIAGRLYRNLGNFDFSLYFYRGFWGSPPGMILDSTESLLTLTHPRLNVYGSSLQGAFLNGVLSLEGGYYDSRDDPQGTNSGIENSQIRFFGRLSTRPRREFNPRPSILWRTNSGIYRICAESTLGFPQAKRVAPHLKFALNSAFEVSNLATFFIYVLQPQ